MTVSLEHSSKQTEKKKIRPRRRSSSYPNKNLHVKINNIAL